MELIAIATALCMGPIEAEDQWRFPFSVREAQHGYQAAMAHSAYVKQNCFPCDWVEDAWRRFKAWDWLDDCRRIHPLSEEACKAKLARIRLVIGPDNFYLGRMPDYLPMHRFLPRGKERDP